MLEMTHFRGELVQLIVSRGDSELEVQRCSIKKNTLTVDPIMLQDELNLNNCTQTTEVGFLKTKPRNQVFGFEFWGQFGSVRFLENRYTTFSSGSTYP